MQNNAEQLSAFIDGELSANEVDNLLDALENPACRDQLARFSRCKNFQIQNWDISGAVAKCIEDETSRQGLTSGRSTVVDLAAAKAKRLQKPAKALWLAASGFAVAASVAVVALNISPALQNQAQPSVSLTAQNESLSDENATVAVLAPKQLPPDASQSLSGAPVHLASTVAGSSAVPVEGRELVIPAPNPMTAQSNSESRELDQLYLQHARFRGGYALAAPVSYGRVGVSMVASPPNEANTR